jgi:hypothetical protein
VPKPKRLSSALRDIIRDVREFRGDYLAALERVADQLQKQERRVDRNSRDYKMGWKEGRADFARMF